MNNDIDMLNRGILPESLKFNQPQQEIDLYKIASQLRYQTTDYWLNRYPPGFENLPGAQNILEAIVEKTLTPIEELDLINSQENKT